MPRERGAIAEAPPDPVRSISEIITREVIPIDDVAAAFNVTTMTIRRWVMSGDLERRFIGRASYITTRSIEALVASGTEKSG